MAVLFLQLLCVLGLLGSGGALPDGAPLSACVSMTPGHGVEQTSANQYSISVDGPHTSYTPFTPLRIQIDGPQAFRGILIQARVVGGPGTPVGTFDDPTTSSGSKVRLLQCFNPDGDAVTHRSALDQTISPGLVLTWNPPDEDVGKIHFVATIAQEKFTWWKGVSSPELSYEELVTQTETTIEVENTESAGPTAGSTPDTPASATPTLFSLSCATLVLVLLVGRFVKAMV